MILRLSSKPWFKNAASKARPKATPGNHFAIRSTAVVVAANGSACSHITLSHQQSSTSNPSTVQGVCPSGWHLPSDAEWTQLTDYLGGESVAGGKLKETGTTHWLSPNTGATNETGFTALPGGYRYDNGPFSDIGYSGYWWSATEGSTDYAWYRNMYYSSYVVDSYLNGKELGFSVRCVRD